MNNFITFLIICIFLVLIILIATYFINTPSNDYEKHSAYESGFEPFGDARSFFDIQFYVIGLLFIIFDLEVVFLIPFVIDISNVSIFGYINFIIFLFIVLVGFYYEWAIGLLNWVPLKTVTSHSIQFQSAAFIEIVIQIDLLFLALFIIVLLSLLFNYLDNLVYRVINLGVLSLVTVCTWGYFTDFVFLYIVYIIAFVGAVIMLFLSVILMLPSSVITPLKKDKNNKTQNITYFITVTEVITEHNYTSFAITLSLFIFIFYSAQLFAYILDFKIYEFRTLFNYLGNLSLTQVTPNNIKKLYKNIKEILGLSVPSAIYGALTNNTINKTLPQLAVIGMFVHDTLNFIYLNVESKLYGPITKHMYDKTLPVWGDLFKFLEFGYAPARPYNLINWPIPDIRKRYIPTQLRFSLFHIFPEPISIIYISYLYGNNIIALYLNRLISLINIINFFCNKYSV